MKYVISSLLIGLCVFGIWTSFTTGEYLQGSLFGMMMYLLADSMEKK